MREIFPTGRLAIEVMEFRRGETHRREQLLCGALEQSTAAAPTGAALVVAERREASFETLEGPTPLPEDMKRATKRRFRAGAEEGRRKSEISETSKGP